MQTGDMLILGGVVAAFVIFGLLLAWASTTVTK